VKRSAMGKMEDEAVACTLWEWGAEDGEEGENPTAQMSAVWDESAYDGAGHEVDEDFLAMEAAGLVNAALPTWGAGADDTQACGSWDRADKEPCDQVENAFVEANSDDGNDQGQTPEFVSARDASVEEGDSTGEGSQEQDSDTDSEDEDAEVEYRLALYALRTSLNSRQTGTARIKGIVETFVPKRGCGMIAPDDGGPHLFVHWTQISSPSKWPRLSKGSKVECTPSDAGGRRIAINISAPGGRPMLLPAEAPGNLVWLSPVSVTGVVLWFHKSEFGFLANDREVKWAVGDKTCQLPRGSSIFVSYEELGLALGSECQLDDGQRVRFKVCMSKGRPVAAVQVTAMDGNLVDGTSPATGRAPLGVQRSIGKRPHVGAAPQPAGSKTDLGAPAGRPRCRFYSVGRCSKGAACAFSHEGDCDGPRAPPCRFFLGGMCTKGTACAFSHDV